MELLGLWLWSFHMCATPIAGKSFRSLTMPNKLFYQFANPSRDVFQRYRFLI
jgi:hypothetical protein